MITVSHAQAWIWCAVKTAETPLTVWEIAQKTGWLPGTILSLTAELEQGGYLTKGPDARYQVTGDLMAAVEQGRDGYAGFEPREDDVKKKPRRHRVPVNVTLSPGVVARAMERARQEGVSLSRLLEELAEAYCEVQMTWTAADVTRYGLTLAPAPPTPPEP